MLLKTIVENYKPVYPPESTWAETSAFLFELEPKLMDELINEYKSNGCFREPIYLSDYGYDEPVVGNGTHRVCVGLHLGIKELDVIYKRSDEGDYALETKITQTDSKDIIDVDDRLSLAFRSFRLNKDFWLNSDMYFGNWTFVWSTGDEELVEEINDRVRAILKEKFSEHDFTVATYRSECEDDD